MDVKFKVVEAMVSHDLKELAISPRRSFRQVTDQRAMDFRHRVTNSVKLAGGSAAAAYLEQSPDDEDRERVELRGLRFTSTAT